MSERAVHWYEGMFLDPQPMQLFERHTARRVYLAHKWNQHYDWGLRSAQIDLDALANHRFVVRALSARLRDGTLIDLPEDGTLDALDLKDALTEKNNITIFLAVPKVHLGKPNVTDPAEKPRPGQEKPLPTRYLLDSLDVEDENTGDNSQPLKVRRLHVKLLPSTVDQSGYELLSIARVQKSTQAEARPQLDVSYIPPLLACDAWPVLAADILQVIFDRVGKKLELLSEQVTSRGINFDSKSDRDPLIFTQLHLLNEAYALLGILCFAQGIHPLLSYLELCRLVGQLSIFGTKKRTPDLPRYDHDDLGGCFYRVKQEIDNLLGQVEEPSYEERPFIGQGLRMQVSLEPIWLEPIWQMYVGVTSELEPEECVRLLTKPGQLDMKIGSAQRVDDIFDRGAAGLKFTPTARPPRALPKRPGLAYFEINRESQQDEWQQVQKTLMLAIRLNQNRIASNIQGQRSLTIKTGAQTTTMQFTLYLTPREG